MVNIFKKRNTVFLGSLSFGILILFLTAIVFPTTTQAATLSRQPNNLGLVGYWSLDDGTGTTAKDFSGKGNNGTLTNGPTWTTGKFLNAVNFDGTNDYITIPENAVVSPGTGDFTISAWIKTSTTNNPDGGVVVGNRGTTSNLYGVYVNPDGTPEFYIKDSGAHSLDAIGAVSVANGQWHQMVAVRSTGTINLYVDNQVVATQTGTLSDVNTSGGHDLSIGAMWNGGAAYSQYYPGSIDDVRLYNRALSTTEITMLYISSSVKNKAITKTGLVGYWPMDEGTGTKAGDFSGNGNTGTLTNGPTWTNGKVSGAVNFDGVDDYITVPDNSSLDITGSMSVGFWINYASLTGEQSIVQKLTAQGAPSDPGWLITKLSNNDMRISLRFVDGRQDYDVTPALSANTWTHLVFVWSASDAKYLIYQNGVLLNQTSTGSHATQDYSTGALKIGARAQSGQDFYTNAKIDDLRIYNRTLSATEIANMYDTGAHAGNVVRNAPQNGQLTSGLVGLWSFNGKDVAGTTAYDRSGNGNNGTLTNGPKLTIGKVGQALQFDGVDDYVDLSTPVLQITDTNTFSDSFWFKTTNPSLGYLLERNGGAANRFGFDSYFVDGVLLGRICKYNIGCDYLPTGYAIATSTWYFATYTYDGTAYKLYVNGILADSISKSTVTGTTQGTGNFVIGYKGTGNTDFIQGIIDEFRVYNRALSATEVFQLYNMGK